MSRTREQPRLASGLITRKGEAVPAVSTDESSPSQSQIVRPSAVQAGSPAPSSRAERPTGTTGTIAVTVRLDPARYERLKIYGLRNRRSNQDLLVEALDSFLELHDC
jgi:hypothetical protein